MTLLRQPTRAGVRDAAAKIAAILPPSPLLVLEIGGVEVAFKAESLQPVGAFKLRGAWHRLTAIAEADRAAGVVAFSSGNHAQGVAWAAKRLGMPAVIVMPADAPKVKLDATLALGAEVVRYDRMTEDRTKIAAHLAHARGAVLVPSFDDAWVIEGQGSAAVEAAAQMQAAGLGDPLRAIVPCGGGGLAAGTALALPDAEIVIAEPEGWDDMTRSLEAGWIEPVGPNPPPTACDALQTMRVAERTFDVLSRRGATGVAVSEEEVRVAQRFAARRLRLVLEPGGAVALAALLAGKLPAKAGTLVLLSGGNTDPADYAAVLAG
ncbi:threonine ammonia-lyase [Sphingomonas qomolangmaensis]|uniref:Threonine/serine dehydratase n=1 Tax=Sphingomonas qomolangmaensis TaxID=2918765 RepID=A0ABY5LBC5_9SPHN|nr:threonine/serine dehydratase [Sphingomonas qomolangmaensis]UUL83246.1 threonine/serine dehydratase [Sphingomonas qomolangmaensis]